MPELALTNVPNIHLASVGHWAAMTGDWDCTPEDLASMVEAEACPALRTPIVKLGHIDPRFDGEPAIGHLGNLRTTDDGMDLYGDAIGVPQWIADIWASAWADRSIEASLNYTDSNGRKHAAVLTGLSLLGVTVPAIQSLEDIKALYAGDLVAARAQAESAQTVVRLRQTERRESRMPNWFRRKQAEQVAASVAIDDVYTEFYEAVPQGSYAWVRQVFSDYLVVDDGDGNLYKLPWSEVDGEVAFGDPVAGSMVFVPSTDDENDDGTITLAGEREGAMALLSHSPDVADQRVRLAAGVPEANHQEESLEIQDLLAEVGLPADATQEQYQARLGELAEVARLSAPEPEAPTATAPEGFTLVDNEALSTLQASASQGQQAFVQLATQERDGFISQAIKLGKVPPARREAYCSMWDADKDGTKALIDGLPEGLVPTAVLAGHAEAGDLSGDDAFYTGLFGSEGSTS